LTPFTPTGLMAPSFFDPPMFFRSLSHFSPPVSCARRALFPLFAFSTFAFLISPFLVPSAQAYEWQNSGIWDSDSTDRAFASGPAWFSAGPSWMMNALPGSHFRARQYVLDSAGDRQESTAETPYVGTLHDVFNVSLFNNISVFAGPSTGKTSTTTLASLNATITWDGGASGNGTALDTNTNWVGDVLPGTTDEVLMDNSVKSPLPATLTTTGASPTYGDLIWNTNNTSTITLNTTGNTSRTITLSGGGTFTAAIAAGGATGDLLVMGTAATSNTLTIGGNSNATPGTARLALAISTDGNVDVVNSGATLNITGILSGNFNLTKTGAGTLTLSGANTFGSGKTFTLSVGTLNINSATALGAGTFQVNGSTIIDSTATFTSQLLTNNNALTLNGNFTFTGTNNLNFGTGAVTLGTSAGASRQITASANTLTIGGVISNGTTANSLIKAGNGTLTLGGANLFTGGVTINAGTVIAGSTTALGPTANATLTFGSGSTGKLQLNGNSITIVDLNTNATVGTPVIESGSGTAGTDTLTVNTANTDTYAGVLQDGSTRLLALTKSGNGTLTLTGTNTYSGGTALSSGTLQLGGSSTGSVTNGPVGTGTLTLNGGTLSSDSTTARSIANAFTFGGDVTLGNGTNNGTLTLSGAGTLTGSRTLTLNSDITYSGNIGETGGSFGITKAGGGTLKLSGVNTYSGGTTVSAGLLWLNSSSALGSTSAPLTVNGGIVDLAGNNASVGNLTGTGGTIWNNLGPSSAVTLTIGNGNNGGGNYQGVITDTNGASPGSTLALTKTGTGTITLSGANTYTGATTVNGGTLLINGSTAAGSAVTVNNSGTLGGTGTVSGTVDVKSGGTLSPGTSPGTMTTGAVTLENGSTFAVDLTATSGNDVLVAPSVTLGTLVTGPNLSLNITGSLSIGQQFFIVNNTGANAVSGVFAQGATVTSGQYTFLIDYLADFGSNSAAGGNDIMLEVTAIPEPSTWIGAALALGAVALAQRRRLRSYWLSVIS
jgi:fibronectin-binding autotransporter adhesin